MEATVISVSLLGFVLANGAPKSIIPVSTVQLASWFLLPEGLRREQGSSILPQSFGQRRIDLPSSDAPTGCPSAAWKGQS